MKVPPLAILQPLILNELGGYHPSTLAAPKPFWPKLLIGSYLVGAGILAGAGALVVLAPDSALPLVPMITRDPSWHTWGPAVLTAIIAFVLWFDIAFIRSKVLVGGRRTLSNGLALVPIALLVYGITPAALRQGVLGSPKAREGFWAGATGSTSNGALLVALVIAFCVSEFLNANMRRAVLSPDQFKATIWSSYPICVGAPIVGMLIARTLLAVAGWSTAVGFVVLTAIVTAPLTIAGTRLLTRTLR